MRTITVDGKDYTVLYTGRRGSHCLGLQTATSDEDLLFVVDSHEHFAERNVDDMVLTELDFIKKVLSCELEAVEALFSKIYITNEFSATYQLLLSTITDSARLSDAKLKFKLFRAVRNQYKLFLKYGREGDHVRSRKHLAKVHLFLELVESDSALECFIKHKIDRDLMTEYFSIREGMSTDEVENLAEKYREIGTSKQVREKEKSRLESLIDSFKN